MPIAENVIHIFEPTPLQCGQAVLAMLSGVSVSEIVKMLANDRETSLKDMKTALKNLGIVFDEQRKEVKGKNQLPSIAILSLQTPRCWHWSLYFKGVFYDPEYGILDDFPPSDRRYYWEIFEKD
ncbi:MAG: hypothetical protein IJZ75_07715 [Clostridia bacterium]|nr:hypothetical protein [Clostridia bacterium]